MSTKGVKQPQKSLIKSTSLLIQTVSKCNITRTVIITLTERYSEPGQSV